MRIVIGELSHETNTFCAQPTTLDDFELFGVRRGGAVVEAARGVRDFLGGMIAAAERLGVELVPTIAAIAEPSGTISHDTYEQLTRELLDGIQAAGRIDAVCLALHGAGMAEGVDDVEGDIIARVRDLVGPDTPLIVTLDLHGNIFPQMVENADALLGNHYYPHTDSFERGIEAVELAVSMVNGDVRPTMHLTPVPMLLGSITTDLPPGRTTVEWCYDWESKPGVLDCAIFHGMCATDLPGMSVTVLATTDGDPELARDVAEDIARRLWAIRDELLPELTTAEEAVRLALASEIRPVVINEGSDNPGTGAPGDGTHLLRELLAADPPATCFGYIWDPETARQAHAAGVGATIRVRLGGKTDTLHGAPIETEAYVKCLTDGHFIVQSRMGQGGRADLGEMARLVIGNVDVIVGSVRTQTIDAELFLLHGIDITRYRIVALKSQQHFRAYFADVAAQIIRADTPGFGTEDLTQLPYQRLKRPIWPLDRKVEFSLDSSAG